MIVFVRVDGRLTDVRDDIHSDEVNQRIHLGLHPLLVCLPAFSLEPERTRSESSTHLAQDLGGYCRLRTEQWCALARRQDGEGGHPNSSESLPRDATTTTYEAA